MEMKLSTVEGGEAAVKAASDKQIRFATMNMAHPYEPARDVNAKWEAASPETAGNWSAAAYFFALDLRKKLGVPVSIVQNARGWTPAEAWTSREAMLADPDLKIIVTGAAQGMGAHFATRLAEAGAQVAAGDVKEDGLAALAEATRGLPGQVHTRRLDVADEADVGGFVEWAHGAMGGLNGLINNAGILRDGLLVKKDRTTGAVTKHETE